MAPELGLSSVTIRKLEREAMDILRVLADPDLREETA
jgi:hypothetical protein